MSFEKIKPPKEIEVPFSESIPANKELVLTPEYTSTMERHKRRRLELLRDFITSRTVDVTLNFVPGIDVPKLAIEGMLGKTLSDEKLTSRRRFDYMLISGGIALSYALAVCVTPDTALAARGAVGVIANVEFGPEMMKDIASKTKEKFPKASAFLEKTASYFAGKREQFIQDAGRIGKEAEGYLGKLNRKLQ
ncbi:MAG: hypothetical protein A2847_00260 [Candidatus Sungbacteria bacterium RIFCSPHIGHO2_01_FULL_50_25]|uniref:Uncharacterized protein n=1 Tax=Candidatus Sungbacteria bacterium RIFCSPHIGHO2_01_FULL_50_25 TaxID=1802265 RepID=A0A1G2KAL2_9BACT|nr:MAG: hypothetical protein A2847_00260 [Candidatus Sungbacteria bacterium RIFCSPHIGHO2_01_FULL_50_25]